MMMFQDNRKEVKAVNSQSLHLEIAELKKVVPYVTQLNDLLKKLEVKSIEEFETKLNEKTGFVKASLSAEALGYEVQYKRLIQLDKLIDNRLQLNEVLLNEIIPSVLNDIKEKHTTYYSTKELEIKSTFNKVIKLYNELPRHVKQKNYIMFKTNGELEYNPFNKF